MNKTTDVAEGLAGLITTTAKFLGSLAVLGVFLWLLVKPAFVNEVTEILEPTRIRVEAIDDNVRQIEENVNDIADYLDLRLGRPRGLGRLSVPPETDDNVE